MPRKIAAKQAWRCGEPWNLQSYWSLKAKYFQVFATIVYFSSAPHIPIFFLRMERDLRDTGILEVGKDARAYVDVQAPVVLKMQYILCRRRRPISLHGLAETRRFRFMYVGVRKIHPDQIQDRPMILCVAEDRVDVGVEFSDGKILEKPLLKTFQRGFQQIWPSCGYKTDVNASFWHFLSHFSHLKPPYLAAAIPYPYQNVSAVRCHLVFGSCAISYTIAPITRKIAMFALAFFWRTDLKASLAIRRDLSALMLRHGAPKHTAGCAAVCISSTTLETDPNKFLNYR